MTAVAERTLQSELHDLVVPLLEKWKVPGVTVGTWSDGEVRTAAFGLANIEANYPMTPDTLLQIGSISKVFTATAIMQLVDAWRLDLEAPVVRYLPDFRLGTPEATEALLVKQARGDRYAAPPARRGLLHPGAPRHPRVHSLAGPVVVRPSAFQVVVR